MWRLWRSTSSTGRAATSTRTCSRSVRPRRRGGGARAARAGAPGRVHHRVRLPRGRRRDCQLLLRAPEAGEVNFSLTLEFRRSSTILDCCDLHTVSPERRAGYSRKVAQSVHSFVNSPRAFWPVLSSAEWEISERLVTVSVIYLVLESKDSWPWYICSFQVKVHRSTVTRASTVIKLSEAEPLTWQDV